MTANGSLRGLLRIDQPIGRAAYAIPALLLAGVKYNFDKLLAYLILHEYWAPQEYFLFVPPLRALNFHDVDLWMFYGSIIAVSIPFIVAGIILTVRRLRDLGANPMWAILFFLPGINVIQFVVLGIRRGQIARDNPRYENDEPALPAIWAATGVAVLGGALLLAFGLMTNSSYGWHLFLSLPFATGATAVAIFTARKPRSLPACMGVAAMSVVFIGALAILLALEGAICIAMALPLWGGSAILGACVAWMIQRIAHNKMGTAMPALMLSLPVLFTADIEKKFEAEPQLHAVVSTLDIAAAPEQVWDLVVAFPPLDPPREWWFRAGIAYPMSARIEGQGVGAIRYCQFSTGPFVEPVDVWDPPHRLHFTVIDNPPPMRELSPYKLETRHLHGYFEAAAGEFKLDPLPGGGTRLTGTTWYKHRIAPDAYWHHWSDALIHHIHLRVLEHIRIEAEDFSRGERGVAEKIQPI